MTEPARPDRQSPGPAHVTPVPLGGRASTLTRGFLFADLRDYTSYIDTHGDRAGAALLERYRILVRGAIADARGAEIRTEGDSFYVVFDSVSAAVRCGMAIVEAATVPSAVQAVPADPVRVGVGVHAGETIETAEGFVGSAVNIAARLCAEAKVGELIVSDTVRSLTRTSLEVDFVPLGARRLKGVAEPIAVYRVVPKGAVAHAGASRAVGRRPSRLLAAGLGAAALVVIVAGGAVVLLGGGRGAASTPGPSTAGAVGSAAGASASPGASVGVSLQPSPTDGPVPAEVEAAIKAALPSTLAETCVSGGTVADAVLAGFIGQAGGRGGISVTPLGSHGGVTCHPVGGATRLYVMTPWNELTRSGNDADEFLGWMVVEHKIPEGSCATGRAHERWATLRGTGLLACMNRYEGLPWIYFTFAKGRYLGFATRNDADYGALYQWWEQLKLFLP